MTAFLEERSKHEIATLASLQRGTSVTTVVEQIQNADRNICDNIAALSGERGLLSQNILAQLRNLVEGVAVLLNSATLDSTFDYAAIDPALSFVKSRGDLNFLGRFHTLLKPSSSHYTQSGDSSERLMLKYFEYLLRARTLLQDRYELPILHNLELFPLDLDPALREYHELIAAQIERAGESTAPQLDSRRYYIHGKRPFFVDGRIYYEVTLHRAVNTVLKFDRLIAFTELDLSDNYAAMLTLQDEFITVLGQTMPIKIIREWEVSIRPCELDNFARLLGLSTRVRTSSPGYRRIMRSLTKSGGTLLDLMDMQDGRYQAVKSAALAANAGQMFPVLDEARRIVRGRASGANVIRYLMLRMRNAVLKSQHSSEPCPNLSGLNLRFGCIPFDQMPFCTSLLSHNPTFRDLSESLDVDGRQHELLARHVKNNVEQRGMLYTSIAELGGYPELELLVADYNKRLYRTHLGRQLVIDRGHAFFRDYEDTAFAIITEIQIHAASGIPGHGQSVDSWLASSPRGIDDDSKVAALKSLFSQSRVALIYGAAGTGKTTMIDHVASYFTSESKLFLSQTNTAVDNLRSRVTAENSTFRTVASQNLRSGAEKFDVLIIDECSTVSNRDMLKVLQNTSFDLLLLVGDVHQIESIQFGNWFSIVRSFVPGAAVFELTTPFRTKSPDLIEFWTKVRTYAPDLTEDMARKGYTTVLDPSLFEARHSDEIILALNYDGLYGINNINRFLQSSNSGAAVTWRAITYKVGDPILFNEASRFGSLIYNNMKGTIVAVEPLPGGVQFDVRLDRPVSESDAYFAGVERLDDSTVRFCVFDADDSDEDYDSSDSTVPFQVAYAVSIHKAQGLEYESVKIVITSANDDDVSHSIFYTAITRARDSLRIFWTPETQQAVLQTFHANARSKDVALLAGRRGLTPRRG